MGWMIKPGTGSDVPNNPPNEGGGGQKSSEVRFLGDLQRLDVKPGDRFVLTLPGPVSMEVHQHIQRCWKSFIGGDAEPLHSLLVLEHGSKLEVIGLDDGADRN